MMVVSQRNGNVIAALHKTNDSTSTLVDPCLGPLHSIGQQRVCVICVGLAQVVELKSPGDLQQQGERNQ